MNHEEISRLRSAVSKLSRRLHLSAKRGGFTPAQASILGVVVAREPISLAGVVKIEGQYPTTLSRVVVELAAEDLIARDQQPDEKRGAMGVAISDVRAKHAPIRIDRASVTAKYVELLSPAQDAQERAMVPALPVTEALSTWIGPSST